MCFICMFICAKKKLFPSNQDLNFSYQSEEKPEELVKLEELLGVSFPHHQPDEAASDVHVKVQQENNQLDPANTDLTFTLNTQKSNVKEEVGIIAYH